jgi:hypothetical protein
MAFVRKQGKTKILWLPVTPSTVILKGALVTLSSGKLICATNTMTNKEIVGVWAAPTIAASDANYALDRLGPVEVPVEKNVIWKAPVNVGTLVATSVGLYFDLDTADTGIGVDQSATALDICFCTKYISATEGEFILNIGPESAGTSA